MTFAQIEATYLNAAERRYDGRDYPEVIDERHFWFDEDTGEPVLDEYGWPIPLERDEY